MEPNDLDAYDYFVPEDQVAQNPPRERGGSRLMVLERASGETWHGRFEDLADLMTGREVLVVNDTRVIPARLVGRKTTGGKAELLLVEPVAEGEGRWRAMGRGNKTLKPGQVLVFGDVRVPVLARAADGMLTVQFPPGLDVLGFLTRQGRVPLPPYIKRAPTRDDEARYQTVWADKPGAVAAPTAGLHFTDELLDRLVAKGVELLTVTLHVGPGTFRPITSQRIDDHQMHVERYEVPEATAKALAEAKSKGRPVVAVGTTVVRTLEAAALAAGPGEFVAVGQGATDLFIRPGFEFEVVDSLITNFHWPRSSLIVLVSALAGRERILAAYQEAIDLGYRLFSYVDAMWIR